jgi:hypothetical protein
MFVASYISQAVFIPTGSQCVRYKVGPENMSNCEQILSPERG